MSVLLVEECFFIKYTGQNQHSLMYSTSTFLTWGGGALLIKQCQGYLMVTLMMCQLNCRSTKGELERHATIVVNESTRVTRRREVFLWNPSNVNKLIHLLRKRLENEGYFAVQSFGDAYVLIVKQAIDYAKVGRDVAVMAEDTDLLVLMMSHWKTSMGNMFIAIGKKLKKKASKKISFWRVSALFDKKSIDQDTLLLAHAWIGCDTTLHIMFKVEIL